MSYAIVCLNHKIHFINVSYLMLIPASLAGLYYPMIASLIRDWSLNENYSHGFFIPLISGYMIITIQTELKNLPQRPLNWGLFLLLLGLGQFYIATVGSEFFLQRTSLILVMIGITLFLSGKAIAKRLLLPIVYLMFMIPLPAILWNEIAFPMQLYSSAITEKVIQFFGMPVFREGNILHLAQTSLEVVDACSGLRSLISMFALSAALAWFSDHAIWKKWVLFLIVSPLVAIFANIVRLAGTAGFAHFYGNLEI